MYGGHITDYFDRRTNNTYLSVIFRQELLKKQMLAPKLQSPDPGTYTYEEYKNLISNNLPSESPVIYGLHPNAEIGFLTQKAEGLCQTILHLEMGSGGGEGGGNTASIVREVLTDLKERCPEIFNMVILSDMAEARLKDEDGPFVVVVLQECTRINALLSEIHASLDELLKGLNGQLNMSQKMEDMFECFIVNQVPGRNPFHLCSWERFAWASKKSLSSWFSDMLLRRLQLDDWTRTLGLPFSIWLPGLMNPTALLTAVKQVTARKRQLPLDNMSLDTYVTRMYKISHAISNAVYPPDGVFVHGLMMEGARWTDEEETSDDSYAIEGVACGGHIVESRLKQLLDPLPLIYVKAVEVLPEWLPESVGYLRSDPTLYECPVYNTSARGPTFVFLAILNTQEPTHKWVLAGVALLMQSDD
jgi:dynein heavy chain